MRNWDSKRLKSPGSEAVAVGSRCRSYSSSKLELLSSHHTATPVYLLGTRPGWGLDLRPAEFLQRRVNPSLDGSALKGCLGAVLLSTSCCRFLVGGGVSSSLHPCSSSRWGSSGHCPAFFHCPEAWRNRDPGLHGGAPLDEHHLAPEREGAERLGRQPGHPHHPRDPRRHCPQQPHRGPVPVCGPDACRGRGQRASHRDASQWVVLLRPPPTLSLFPIPINTPLLALS